MAAQKLMLELQESSADGANVAGEVAGGAGRGAVPLLSRLRPPPPTTLLKQPPPPPQQPPDLGVPRSGFNGVEECGRWTFAAGTGGGGEVGSDTTRENDFSGTPFSDWSIFSGGSGSAGVGGEPPGGNPPPPPLG